MIVEYDVNEGEKIDIMTVEKDTSFSDSNISQQDLCFLLATLTRDVHEQQESS